MLFKSLFGILGILITLSYPNSRAVGSTQSMLNRLQVDKTSVSRLYTLMSPAMVEFQVKADDYYFEEGMLSMTGHALESENSNFILKGNEESVYGWVVMRDKNIAYEYTTDAEGMVKVEQVPVAKIYPICNLEEENPNQNLALTKAMPTVAGPEPHIGPYAGQDLNKLQSLPGAKKVLWADISRVMNGGTPKNMTAAEFFQFWQIFASSYSHFQVNVTTDPEVFKAAGVTNSGTDRMLDETGRSSCPINAFGTTSYCTCYRQSTFFNYGKTNAHETGHLMGLNHDGSATGGEYYFGHAPYQWNTIMGNNLCCSSWPQAAIQWSKGEYTGANNTQDDLAVLSRNLPYRADDIPATVALVVTGTDSISSEKNRGQISQNNDSDSFSFELGVGGGRVKLLVDRTEERGGSALDIDAKIMSGGQVLSQSNVQAVRSASFDTTLPAGKYTLIVKGGAEGVPATGFSKYASLGFYAISGKIANIITVPILDKRFSTLTYSDISFWTVYGDSKLKLNIPRGSKVGQIALYSTRGEMVYQSNKRVSLIDMSGWPTGVYLLKLKIDEVWVVRKFTKK